MERLDVVIFGASGFTGKKAVAKAFEISTKVNITWGIAGRSKKKLEDLVGNLAKNAGVQISNPNILIADASNEQSLRDMCSRAKIIVNCCGPYLLYGEQVVKACLKECTHYVDISGEPEFIELMQYKYDKTAHQLGVFVISACGFESVPIDLGVLYLQEQFDGTLNSIEAYTRTFVNDGTVEQSINFGTWNTFVLNAGRLHRLRSLRKKLYNQRLPLFKPKLKSRGLIHHFNEHWCVPFPAVDKSIVYRSQRYFYETSQKQHRPIQFKLYAQFTSIYTTLLVLALAAVVFLMSKTKFTRYFLLNYPEIFSLGVVTNAGPSETTLSNTQFEIKLIGKGWKDKSNDIKKSKKEQIVTVIRGMDPVYGVTVTCLLWSAITILQDRNRMPINGGVLTTAAAFSTTNLLKNLKNNGVNFSVLK